MGEAKRKREKMSPVERKALGMSHALVDQGLLIEGGFAAYCIVENISFDDPGLARLRHAYMTGAEHLYSSMMTIFDSGSEPTEKDLVRMKSIHDELARWKEAIMTDYAQKMRTSGSA